MKNHLLKLGLVGLTALGLTACGGSSAAESGSETRTLTFTTLNSADLAQSKAFEHWAETVTERTDGAIQFESNYNSSLCEASNTAGCVSNGTADVGWFSAENESSLLPVSTVGAIGFSTQDLLATPTAFRELHETQEILQSEWENAGLYPLYSHSSMPNIVASSSPISELSELEGMQLRTTGEASLAVSELGVNSVSMSLADSYEGIERGVVSGLVTSMEGLSSMGLEEVAPYIYNIGTYWGASTLFHLGINDSVWKSLDPEVQDVMTEVAMEVETSYVDRWHAEYSQPQCEHFVEMGVEVTEVGSQDSSAADSWAESAREQQVADWKARADNMLEDSDDFLATYFGIIEENSNETSTDNAFSCM